MKITLFILLAAAIGFIFCLIMVLKKTFNILDCFLNKNREKLSAYNGKYYPAIVINQFIFNSKEEKIITDFSIYEEKKVVGYIICLKENQKEYCKKHFIEEELLNKPMLIQDAVIYEIEEGNWMWEPA